jgi:hypothetical protein
VYWLSPADGPSASATAGGTIATRTSANANQALLTRRERTLRVLQQSGCSRAPEARPTASGAPSQTHVLQDFLHRQVSVTPVRRAC